MAELDTNANTWEYVQYSPHGVFQGSVINYLINSKF